MTLSEKLRIIAKPLIIALLCVFFCRVSGVKAQEPDIEWLPEPVWSQPLGLELPHAPLCLDIDLNKQNDAVVSSKSGRIVALHGESGRILWDIQLDGHIILNPVWGFFTSDLPEIAVLHSDGLVNIIRAATGEIVFTGRLKSHRDGPRPDFSISPSLLPVFHSQYDSFLAVDDAQRIYRFSIQEEAGKFSLIDEWQNLKTGVTGNFPRHALAVGAIQRSEKKITDYGIILPSVANKVIALKSSAPNRPALEQPLLTTLRFDSHIALIHDQNGIVQKVYASDPQRGLIHFSLDWDKPQVSRPVRLSGRTVSVQNPFSPLACPDITGDGIQEVCLYGTTQVYIVDGGNGEVITDIGQYQSSVRTLGPGGAVIKYSKPGLDQKPRAYLLLPAEPAGWVLISTDNLSVVKESPELPNGLQFAVHPTVVFTGGPGSGADILAFDRKGGVHLMGTTINIYGLYPAWGGERGSPLRASSCQEIFYSQRFQILDKVRDRLANLIREAEWNLEAGAYRKALEAAEEGLRISPDEESLKKVSQAAYWGAHKPQLFFFAIALLALLTVIVIILWRILARKHILRQSQHFVEIGRIEKIPPAFKRHFRLHKWQPELVRKFAEICRENAIRPEGMEEILEGAYNHKAPDQNLAVVLADLYLYTGRNDEEAREVYQTACDILKNDKNDAVRALAAPYEFILGRQSLAEGDLQTARERLETAYRFGVQNEEILVLISKVYIRLDIKSSRHLSIILRALESVPQDAELLKGAAKCYLKERQQRSPKAQEIFQRLALVEPDSVLANEQIASLSYWSGDYQKAKAHAQRVLAIEPDSPTALQIMAWGLWRDEKNDPDSRDIYARALKHFPEDQTINRANAEIALDRERPDHDDLAVINRAMESVSSEPDFLSHVAAVALCWKEYEQSAVITARKALEKLEETDALSEEQTLRLAALYVEAAEDATEGLPRADGPENNICDILARAFNIDPEAVPGLPRVLGAMLIRLGRHDPQYIDVFQTLVEREAHQPIWAIELATILRAQENFERVLEVLQPVLEYNPELESSVSTSDSTTGEESPTDLKARIHRLLAAAHANLKEFNKAIDYYKSLLEANPEDPQAIVGLGMAYARMGQPTDEMHMAIARARDIAPDDPLLNFAVGERLAGENRWDAATTCLIATLKGDTSYADQVLRLTSTLVGRLQGEASIPARWLRVKVLLELSMYDGVLEELEMIDVLDQTERTRILMLFQEILKEAPGNIEALYGRGRILRRLGRFPQARRSLEEALRQAPDYLPAKRMLLEVYTEILKDEESPSLYYSTGQIAMQLEDFDRAVTAFQRARQDPGFERMSRRHLAECFMRKGILELALLELQNIAIDDETKPLLYQLADEFEGIGNVFGARQALQMIYSLDAGYKDIAERLNRLAHSSQANPELMAQLAAEQRAEIQQFVGDLPEDLSEKPQPQATQPETSTRYDLLEEIGRGAMASVYRARDNELDEVIALKILPESLLQNPEALRRFRLEARSSRKLSHDNIVRIHDFGEERGKKYISMEYVEGRTLKDLIRASARDTGTDVPRIAVLDLTNYARQIARAMRYAHEQGIIHRDLKPANIMITPDGKVKVADFGIAKAVEVSDQSHGTITGAIVGTPLYMSPEQIMGESCDTRTDIYSFGILLYEGIIGHAPFNQGDLAYQHLHVDPEPIPENVDPIMREIIMKCLEKDPEERWQNFTEILEKLDAIQ